MSKRLKYLGYWYFPKEIIKLIILHCSPISFHSIWIYVSKEIAENVRQIGRERTEILKELREKYRIDVFLKIKGVSEISWRELSDVLFMFDYWCEERGKDKFICGEDGEYVSNCFNISRPVWFRWKDIVLAYHWDESFVDFINKSRNPDCEVMTALIMKGSKYDMDRVWKILGGISSLEGI